MLHRINCFLTQFLKVFFSFLIFFCPGAEVDGGDAYCMS